MVIRFKRVDEPDDNAVTVTIFSNGKDIRANVTGPLIAGRAMASQDVIGQKGNLAVSQALNIAATLADKDDAKIVIYDEERLWKKEWGELI